MGYPRQTIALNNKISTGSVSNIIYKARSIIPNLDIMRQIALMVTKKEIDLNDIAPAVRLKKILDRLGLSEEKLEEFIESTDIYCFKKEIDIEEFIPKIHNVYNLSTHLDIPVEAVSEYIEAAEVEKNNLDKEIEKRKKIISELIEEHDLTKNIIVEYVKDWPLQHTIEKKDKIIRELYKKIYIFNSNF